MGYCSDGDGQFRWPSAFERGELIDGLRSRAANGGEATSETGEVETAADVVVPPPGHRGVLISGTVDATTKTAAIASALPLPYSGDAAPGAGAYTLRVEDQAGQVLTERRFTPNVRFGDGEGDGLTASFGEVVAIPQAATIGKVTVVNTADGSLGTRSAATWAGADGRRGRDLRSADRRRPGHVDLEALARLGLGGALLARRRRDLAPVGLPPER